MCGIDIDLFQKLDFIEFRQELLFRNTDLDRLIFENKFTRLQYEEIVQLMDMFNNKEDITKDEFENTILTVLRTDNKDLPMKIAYSFLKQNKYIKIISNLY